MRPVLALASVVALSALVVVLVAHGGDGGDRDERTVTPVEPAVSTAGAPSDMENRGKRVAEQRRNGGHSAAAAQNGSGDLSETADALAAEPGSIRSARVTATGAVQTLPPSGTAQAEALKNSYSSIKSFGLEAEGADATEITFALVQYLDAKARGDWATACARIYSVLRASLEKEGADCATVAGSLLSRASASSRAEAASIDVASVRRGEGNRAFVIYKTPHTLSADMPMYLEGGVWTVGALEAYVLTPEQLEAG